MVMPERLPTPLPSSPERPASASARVVAAPVVVAAEFTDAPKRRSFKSFEDTDAVHHFRKTDATAAASRSADLDGDRSERRLRADPVEKLFAASANFQKAENCSP